TKLVFKLAVHYFIWWRDFDNNGLYRNFRLVLTDMTETIAAAQPIIDLTVDALRLFNLYYCVYEVLLRYEPDGVGEHGILAEFLSTYTIYPPATSNSIVVQDFCVV
ncbi:UNVERIFIED_CONTAM: hypothetical protein HDU68_000231, partial [Siphonaria sp. JEL0065]